MKLLIMIILLLAQPAHAAFSEKILFAGKEYNRISKSIHILRASGGGVLLCRNKKHAKAIAKQYKGTIGMFKTIRGKVYYRNQYALSPWKKDLFYGVEINK